MLKKEVFLQGSGFFSVAPVSLIYHDPGLEGPSRIRETRNV